MKISMGLLFCLFLWCFAYSSNEDKMTSYPKIILDILNLTPRWTPTEKTTEECLESLKKINLDPERCRAKNKLNFYDSFRSKIFFDFDATGKYGFQNIDFQLSSNLKVRGLLGLHTNEKRPLVIFRMGIHGNRDEFMAERFLIKIFYQDLGYHVLMIESLTSQGFILSNNDFSVGGLEEGLHTFFILNQIRNNKFKWVDQISEIHLAGISMGGPGVFLTTYLDEQTNHQVKSSLVFCPLINFKKNFERLSEPGLKNVFADLWNSQRLQSIVTKNPELKTKIELWKMFFDLKPRFAPTVFEWLNDKSKTPLLTLNEFNKQFSGLKIPQDFVKHIESSHNLYDLNEFWPLYKNEKTPIQIVTTFNDPLVFNDLNSELIRQKKQPGVFNKISFVDLEGTHCSLAEEYQWPYLVEMVRRSL